MLQAKRSAQKRRQLLKTESSEESVEISLIPQLSVNTEISTEIQLGGIFILN